MKLYKWVLFVVYGKRNCWTACCPPSSKPDPRFVPLCKSPRPPRKGIASSDKMDRSFKIVSITWWQGGPCSCCWSSLLEQAWYGHSMPQQLLSPSQPSEPVSAEQSELPSRIPSRTEEEARKSNPKPQSFPEENQVAVRGHMRPHSTVILCHIYNILINILIISIYIPHKSSQYILTSPGWDTGHKFLRHPNELLQIQSLPNLTKNNIFERPEHTWTYLNHLIPSLTYHQRCCHHFIILLDHQIHQPVM